jgi:anti-sigma factor RsiW
VTSTTGAAGHPDVDQISALTEDLLPPDERAEIEAHLEGCPDCSDIHASLEEVRVLLGELSDPISMPEDVAERIDAALAAEALVAAAQSPSSGRPHVSRETSPGESPRTPAERPGGHPGGATGPGRAGRGARKRRRTITLGAVFTLAVLGLGTFLLQSLDGDDSSKRPPEASSAHPSGSRQTFSTQNLEGQVTSLLKKHPVKSAPDHETTGGSDSVTPSPTPTPSLDMGSPETPPKTATPLHSGVAASVPDCIRKGIGRAEEPLAAEQGVFQGTDAYLVVLPHESDPTKVSAYVVDATCTHRPALPTGAILLTQSYPRD